MTLSPPLLDATLAAQGEALFGYVRQRLGPEAAQDVLQDALLRAIEQAPALDAEADLTRWLWRVVRNATVDVHRRRQAEGRRLDAWAAEQPVVEMPPGEAPAVCGCYRPLLDALDPPDAEVLRAVDLGGEPAADVAARLGLSAGALRVRRHRARQRLREQLEAVCRACADDGCADCSCPPTPSLPPLPPMDTPTPTDALQFTIEGMTCGGCVAAATRALDRTPGVAVEQLSLDAPAVVRLSDGASREDVRAAVEGAGFRPVFDAE